MKKRILLTAGPTPVPPEVLQVLAEPIIYHRTPEHRAVFGEAIRMLEEVFRTKNDVFALTSSGPGAMEAAVANFLSAGDKVIVAHAGIFGERWAKIAKAYGMSVVEVTAAYGLAVNPEKLREVMGAHPGAKAVFATLCETSTGVNHDVKTMAQIVNKTNAIFVVDAISGLGADPFSQDEWGIDVVVGGSQKGLMIPPGLGFVSVGPKAWALAERTTTPRFYFDLRQYKKSMADSDTPFTPAVSLTVALKKALEIIRKKGIEQHIEDTRVLAEATRAAVKALRLELFAKERPSNVVTSVTVPSGVDGSKLLKTMRDEFGVTLAGGQGTMIGKIFRIAHLGYITKDDLKTGLECLCQVLSQAGYSCRAKDALDAFEDAVKPGRREKLAVKKG